MSWETLKERLGLVGQGSSAPFVLPPVVLELEPDFVAGARLEGSPRQVRRLGVRELEVGALLPFPSRPNIVDEGAVRRAVSGVVEAVGNGSSRLGLLLPDASVRVAVLRFETLPEDRKEAESLVRWRMRDILPFAPEEARVCYQVLARETDAIELLALAVRNSVLAEYEAALESVNGGASLILPATVALLPLLPEGTEPGQLLIHVCFGSITTVMVAEDRVRFWRNRALQRTVPGELPGEVAREVGRVLATCRDHLKVEVGHVWLCARPAEPAELGEELARALGREVRPLPGGAGRAAMLPPTEQELFQRFGMTFAGLVANLG